MLKIMLKSTLICDQLKIMRIILIFKYMCDQLQKDDYVEDNMCYQLKKR